MQIAAEAPSLAEAQSAVQRADDVARYRDEVSLQGQRARDVCFNDPILPKLYPDRAVVDEGTKFAMFPGEGEKPRREGERTEPRSVERRTTEPDNCRAWRLSSPSGQNTVPLAAPRGS